MLNLHSIWPWQQPTWLHCAFNIGSVITIARRNLVDIFLKSDFDYIWWVDSDMKFPIDAPIRLLSRNKEIVGANYRRRRFPNPNFTGMMGKSGAFQEFQTTDNSPAMELIDVLPHGMVMCKREVYEKIPQPHYLQEYVPHLNLEIGEDIYFCQQAQKAGYQIWCDQELSREIAHIGIQLYCHIIWNWIKHFSCLITNFSWYKCTLSTNFSRWIIPIICQFKNKRKDPMLFESIEIRKVCNGVIVTLRSDDDEDQEYVYDTDRKAIKFVKDLLESKGNVSVSEAN